MLGQRIVEVYAGDRLHLPAVAIAQPAPVCRLHRADVRRAVSRQRDLFVLRQQARHAGRPQHLVVDRRLYELVNITDGAQRFPRRVENRGHELEQRLREIGRDKSIRQRRTEGRGMGQPRHPAIDVDTQGFLLDAALGSGQHTGVPRHQAGESAVELVAHAVPWVVRPNGVYKSRGASARFSITIRASV